MSSLRSLVPLFLLGALGASGCARTYTARVEDVRAALRPGARLTAPVPVVRDDGRAYRLIASRDARVTPAWSAGAARDPGALTSVTLEDAVAPERGASSVLLSGPPGLGLVRGGAVAAGAGALALTTGLVMAIGGARCLASATDAPTANPASWFLAVPMCAGLRVVGIALAAIGAGGLATGGALIVAGDDASSARLLAP